MPLSDHIGQRVTCEFAGRPVTGVIRDVHQRHADRRFESELAIARKGGATLRVDPDALIDQL